MEEIHEPVSVLSLFDAEKRLFQPLRFRWHGRVYKVQEVAMHIQPEIKGRLHHVYALSCGGLECILDLDTITLQWTLEKIQLPE